MHKIIRRKKPNKNIKTVVDHRESMCYNEEKSEALRAKQKRLYGGTIGLTPESITFNF